MGGINYRLHSFSNNLPDHLNGPWRITFEWEDGDALKIDLEQYH